MLIPFGTLAATRVDSDFELIQTSLVGTATTNLEFLNIPQEYRHLQFRITARSSLGSNYDNLSYYFNNDTGNNYSTHALFGSGSSVGSNAFTSNPRGYWPSLLIANSNTANVFQAGIIDILDYTSTTKHKTVRSFIGNGAVTPTICLVSNRWGSASAITRINFETSVAIMAGSRFSLYGIRG
jgi:hypothetical protein